MSIRKKTNESSELSRLDIQNYLDDISFCDKRCKNVSNNAVKSIIINHLSEKYNVNAICRLFSTITPKIENNVINNEHVLSTLTIGNPYLLFVTKINNKFYSLIIDRKLKEGFMYPKIHHVNYTFENLEGDTVFEGELVRDSNRKWFFIISDLLVLNSNVIKHKNILLRFKHIYNILKNNYVRSQYDVCPIQVKKLFNYKSINELYKKYIPSLSYKCKGILFHSLNSKYCNYVYLIPRDSIQPISNQRVISLTVEKIDDIIETYEQLFDEQQDNDTVKSLISVFTRMKDDNQLDSNNGNEPLSFNRPDRTKQSVNPFQRRLNYNSNGDDSDDKVVFKVLKTDMSDIYKLYYYDNENVLQCYNYSSIPDIKTSFMMNNIFNDADDVNNVFIKCRYSKSYDKWIPVELSDASQISKLSDINKVIRKISQKEL